MDSSHPDFDESLERAARMEKAANDAISMVKAFGERDPYDSGPDNPWQNPQKIFDQLNEARDNVLRYRRIVKDTHEVDIPKDEAETDEFRAQYIEMITDAFAEELEALRANQEENFDVDILVDCLQSGMHLFTKEENEIFSKERSGQSTNQHTSLTPHEQRRRQLGFHLESK